MSLQKYLKLMFILTGICWFAWLLVLFFINPDKSGLVGFVLFYFSLFLAIIGSASILGFIIRVRLEKKPVFKQVEMAFRQGVWTSVFIICILILQGLTLLRWWNALFLALFLVFLELFFLTSGKKYKI